MDRRRFLLLLRGVPFLSLSSEAGLAAEHKTPGRKYDGRCGICGGVVVFDNWLDINLCPHCGSHETTQGWEKP